MLKEGERVRHRAYASWGTGTVVAADARHLVIEFPPPRGAVRLPTRTASDLLEPTTEEASPASGPAATALAARCQHCDEPLRFAQHTRDRDLKSCPRCSVRDGAEHVFYESPAAFGTTEARASAAAPEGLQSYCSACRTIGGRGSPDFPPRRCSEVLERKRQS